MCTGKITPLLQLSIPFSGIPAFNHSQGWRIHIETFKYLAPKLVVFFFCNCFPKHFPILLAELLTSSQMIFLNRYYSLYVMMLLTRCTSHKDILIASSHIPNLWPVLPQSQMNYSPILPDWRELTAPFCSFLYIIMLLCPLIFLSSPVFLTDNERIFQVILRRPWSVN